MILLYTYYCYIYYLLYLILQNYIRNFLIYLKGNYIKKVIKKLKKLYNILFIIFLFEMYSKLIYIYIYKCNTNLYCVNNDCNSRWRLNRRECLYINTIEYLLFHIVPRMQISSGFPLVSRNEIIIEKYLHQ